MCGRRRGACVPGPSVAKSQDPQARGARRARKAAKRSCEKIELRPLPAASTVVPVLSRGAPLPGKTPPPGEPGHTRETRGTRAHGSQLGGTVSNWSRIHVRSRSAETPYVASRKLQVAQASKVLQVAIWVHLLRFTCAFAGCIWGVCAFLHGTKRLLACLRVATLLTTGPVVVRLAEMTIQRVREQVVPLLVNL